MNMRLPIARLRIVATALACIALGGCSSSTSSHLAYVATSSGVFAFRINDKTGAPTTIFSAPFVLGRSPSAIVIGPSGNLAYISNELDNTISLVKIDTSSGALSEILPRTPVAGLSPSAMVMDPAGSFLYVAEQGTNDVASYSVGSDGSLSLVSTASVGAAPSGMALSKSGDLLFVAVPSFLKIYAFTLSAGTLTPATGSPFAVSDGVISVAIDPTASFLYAPNPTANTISGFSILSGGVLSQLPTSPYGNTKSPLRTPVANAVDPTGKFLYVANFASTSISEFDVSGTGELTPATTASASAGTSPDFFAFDPNGKYMYVANEGSNSFTEFLLNSDGTLTSKNTIQVGAVPRSIAFTK
jgi:6-phosphogluconolactonase